MIKLINALTGSEMWVHENRLEEYLAAGHKPAPLPAPPKPAEKKPRSSTKK